ncbi:MAG TPA: response regulator [Phycisphaerales bacterium]|nr:response regulator [Phycisphaerales bacterium]
MPRSFGCVRILVADDEHLPATGLAGSAADLGHSIVGIAPDGERAVAMAREFRPDLALLDIRMPRLSGIDAAMVLFGEMKIPSIIISAYSDEENVKRIHANGEAAGVFGYLLKPVSREQLAVAIGIALQRAAVDGQHIARVQQLEANLLQRRTVEQAKWILVQKRKITEPEAHDLLQKLARNQRKQLADVAQIVVTTGDLPA